MSQVLQENLTKLDRHLARFRDRTLGHFIDGEETEGSSGETFTNLTPVDNSPVNEVARGGQDEVKRAADAAVKAFGDWRDMPGARRRGLLHEIADAIEARAEEIALVESFDTGQPLRFMSSAALRGAENFRFYADKAPEARNGLSTPADQHVNYSIRQPIGPVGLDGWETVAVSVSQLVAGGLDLTNVSTGLVIWPAFWPGPD